MKQNPYWKYTTCGVGHKGVLPVLKVEDKQVIKVNDFDNCITVDRTEYTLENLIAVGDPSLKPVNPTLLTPSNMVISDAISSLENSVPKPDKSE